MAPGLSIKVASLGAIVSALWGVSVVAHASDDIPLPKQVTWTAYDVGSTGYNQAVAIGSALKNKLGVNLRVLPGKNDVARLAPLRDGKVDFSSAGSDSIYAQEGMFVFGTENWGPIPIRMLLMNISDGASTAMAVTLDSGIEKVADLKGKRFAIVKGSPVSHQLGSALLAFAGLTLDDVQQIEASGFAATAQALQDNSAEAYVTATHTPNNIKLHASPRGLKFLPFPHDDEEGWKRVKEVVPWMFKHTATLGPGIPPEGIEVATTAYPLLIALEETPEDLAYGMTKAMFVLHDDYADGAPGANGWRLSSQKLDEVFQPIHPGAIRYYQEIGVWTPERQKVHEANLHRQSIILDAWEAFFPNAPKGDEAAFEKAWLSARADALTKAGLVTIIEGDD